MLKFYSLLIGENPNYTAQFHPSGKRKIMLLGTVLLIPITLWFVNGFFLVRDVMEAGVLAALATGFCLAAIIFTIERAIILSNGGKAIVISRVILGFCIALLGSICMDEVIFKDDIDLKIALYKKEHIKTTVELATDNALKDIASQEKIVRESKDEWLIAEKDAAKEADGSGGSGTANVGKIALFKASQAAKFESEYEKENQKLSALQNHLNQKELAAEAGAAKNFNGKGLLIRIKALFDLVCENPYMLGSYILLTLVIFFLEFIVVLIKVCSHSSIDEKLEKARDQNLEDKMNQLLARKNEYRSAHEILQKVRDANQINTQYSSSMFN